MRARAGALGGAVLVATGVAWAAMWLAGPRVLAADNTGVISGVVTSAKGPEAGVWVIAETDDLPTKFRKIVVTDDQGRFLLPELPKRRSFKVWVRGYGLVDSQAGDRARPDQDAEAHGRHRRRRRRKRRKSIRPATGRRCIEPPDGQRVSRHRARQGNGINPALQDQDELIKHHQVAASAAISSAASRRATIPDRDKFVGGRRLGSPRQRGQRGSEMSAFMTRFGPPARPEDVRRLDRRDRRRRGAAGAAAPAGHRAQRRHHDVELGRRVRLDPRRDRHRPAQPDG